MTTTATAATATNATTRPCISLTFEGLPATLVRELEETMHTLKVHPFLATVREKVEVLRHPVGLVFRLDGGKGGYSFCRNVWCAENDIQMFRHFLHDPAQLHYMPIAYEVKEQDDSVAVGIVERYQNYGVKHAAKIDWVWFVRNSTAAPLLIMRIPKEIIRGLLWSSGGTLTTSVRGPVREIRKLPVLSRIVPEEAGDDEVMHRAFITTYGDGQGQYDECMAVHQAAVREVIAAGGCGVSIGPIAVWTP